MEICGLLAQEIFGINLKRTGKRPTQQIKVHCTNNIKPAKLCTDKVVWLFLLLMPLFCALSSLIFACAAKLVKQLKSANICKTRCSSIFRLKKRLHYDLKKLCQFALFAVRKLVQLGKRHMHTKIAKNDRLLRNSYKVFFHQNRCDYHNQLRPNAVWIILFEWKVLNCFMYNLFLELQKSGIHFVYWG